MGTKISSLYGLRLEFKQHDHVPASPPEPRPRISNLDLETDTGTSHFIKLLYKFLESYKTHIGIGLMAPLRNDK